VIRFVSNNYSYKKIFLAGYSLGGNQILKFLGEKGSSVNSLITAAVTVSAPTDLIGSSEALARFSSKFYMNRFLKTLKSKTLEKLEKFPDAGLDREKIMNAKNFYDFDNAVTAPVFGFKDAYDYWIRNSSKPFIPEIRIPSLLITAQDDPFLNNSCYPVEEAKENSSFHLELNKFGGHVGFNSNISAEKNIWLDQRILRFFEEQR
jgi:predicted alpha/beta-fold hydrolase